MAREEADSNKKGWFARWRERRKSSKLRASELERRAFDARQKDQERIAKSGGVYERRVPRPRLERAPARAQK